MKHSLMMHLVYMMSGSIKGWSLTDCISFVIMNEYGVSEAWSGDRHFSQAGFTLLYGKQRHFLSLQSFLQTKDVTTRILENTQVFST